jgi:hypothetical protein
MLGARQILDGHGLKLLQHRPAFGGRKAAAGRGDEFLPGRPAERQASASRASES